MDRANLKLITEKFQDEFYTNETSVPQQMAYRSTALDNVLSQNEDLMIRMKVILKRLVSFEDENLKLLSENKELRYQLSSLSDQISIFREKEGTWKDRALAAEEAIDLNNCQLRQKEIEYAQLRAQDWQDKEQLKHHLEKLDKQRLNLLRYKARIRLYVHPLVKNLKKMTLEYKKNLKIQKNLVENLQNQNQNNLNHSYELIKSHKEDLKIIEDQKLQMITQFERNQDDFKNEIKSLNELNYELNRRVEQLDKSLERQDYLENRVIELERTKKELKDKYTLDLDHIQKQFYLWRNHAQSLEINNKTISQQITELTQSFHTTTDLKERLQEQLDALRHLWNDTSKENSRLSQANEALEKLNAELCLKLNEFRTQKLKDEIESQFNEYR